MKKFLFPRSLVWILIFSFSLQPLMPSFLYAQGRGMFVRDKDIQDDGSSFRTDSGVDNLTTLGERSGEGVFQKKQLEGLEMGVTERASAAGTLIYQIHILGEVKHPGTYRIPASTRLSEALQMAGGIKKNGSERGVQVKRPGGIGKKMDLLAYKVYGHLQDNPYLMDNDVIHVPLRQRVIEVEGAVNRPGVYELRDERWLYNALQLAGGFSQGVSRKDFIRIVRYDETEKKNIVEVGNTLEEIRHTELLNGDVIVVPHMFTTQNRFDYNIKQLPNDNIFYPSFEDRVFVIGAVGVPGAYNFNQYYGLRNYLALAGGMSRMAKGYIKVVNPEGKVIKVRSDANMVVNPGDTLYIPEKTLSREAWIGVLSTLAGFGLSVTSLAISLTR